MNTKVKLRHAEVAQKEQSGFSLEDAEQAQ
jgi:hypothetical protein